jgi:hypothetical protein
MLTYSLLAGRGPGALRRGAAGAARGRWISLVVAVTFVVSLAVTTGSAQAVMLSDAGSNFGVALVPGSSPTAPGVSVYMPANPADCDPALTLPTTGLCAHGGPVIHSNETFALTWDDQQHSNYAANYVEHFLKDVADGSGTLTSPYAITSQYTGADQSTGAAGRAGNASIYGGSSKDGHSYPANGCQFSGTSSFHGSNDVCLTDIQIKTELESVVSGLGRVQPGYTPVLVLLTPPGVETCLDSAGNLCSANNSTSAAKFCSYHSQVTVGPTVVDYLVQPWVTGTGCDEPGAPAFPTGAIDPGVLATDMGIRLVGPLSQAQIATIVNPGLNGWYASNGSEINDNNGCAPLGPPYDSVTVGGSGQNPYLLQREFSNAGLMVDNPFVLACAPSVGLAARFVVPSSVNPGDVLELDGSTTLSSLLVPNANYAWSFGDGTSTVGPSVAHSYVYGGTFNVTLTVTDRGGNISSLSQTIDVLGAQAPPVPPPPPARPGSHPNPSFQVRIQLMPQGLRAMLRDGVSIHVRSNERANGFVTVLISRNTAKRAHINPGRGATVAIGRGTYSGIKNGTVYLHLHLSKNAARKLGHLAHLTLTVRLALLSINRDHLAIVAAASY